MFEIRILLKKGKGLDFISTFDPKWIGHYFYFDSQKRKKYKPELQIVFQ